MLLVLNIVQVDLGWVVRHIFVFFWERLLLVDVVSLYWIGVNQLASQSGVAHSSIVACLSLRDKLTCLYFAYVSFNRSWIVIRAHLIVILTMGLFFLILNCLDVCQSVSNWIDYDLHHIRSSDKLRRWVKHEYFLQLFSLLRDMLLCLHYFDFLLLWLALR